MERCDIYTEDLQSEASPQTETVAMMWTVARLDLMLNLEVERWLARVVPPLMRAGAGRSGSADVLEL